MKRFVISLFLLAVAITVGACGGSPSGGGAPAGSITVSLTEFKFAPSSISTHAGKVVFYLENTGSAAHDMVITDSSGAVVAKSDLIQAGEKGLFTVAALAAGTYRVTCDLPGHAESGMTATLSVT